MSDYLSNLVNRSLNPGSVIRPRRASLFEPEAATAGPKVHETSEPISISREGEPTAERVRLNRSEISDRSPRETALISEIQPTPLKDDRSHPDVRHSDDRKTDVHSDTIQPAVPQAQARVAQSSLLIPTETTKVINQTSENVSVISHDDDRETDRSAETKGPEIGWPRIEKNVRQLIDDRFNGLQPLSSKANSPEMNRERDASPAIPRVIETPQPVSIRPASLAVTQPVPLTGVAPTIKVTIGRIDVRAVAQSPRVNQPRPRPTAAPQSLDEYLKHRSGVRR